MVQTRASFSALSLLLTLACSPSTPAVSTNDTNTAKPVANADADKDAVGKAHDVLEGAFKTSDCNAMVANATNEAVLEPPNSASANGVDGVKSWCTAMFTQMKTKSLAVTNKDMDISGDIAVDHGEYDWTLTPVKGGADVRAQGRYVSVFHRQSDGSWKWTRLIWNSSQPMPKA
jgi:ketosteroid isomerase-like protein